MDSNRPYWNMEIEPLLNTPEMEKIQFDKLKKMLARLNANAPFYTAHDRRKRTGPGKVKKL